MVWYLYSPSLGRASVFAVFELEEFDTFNFCPGLIVLLDKPFHDLSLLTEIPYFFAINPKFSPFFYGMITTTAFFEGVTGSCVRATFSGRINN